MRTLRIGVALIFALIVSVSPSFARGGGRGRRGGGGGGGGGLRRRNRQQNCTGTNSATSGQSSSGSPQVSGSSFGSGQRRRLRRRDGSGNNGSTSGQNSYGAPQAAGTSFGGGRFGGNSQLSDTERQAAREARRAGRADRKKQFDTDGDGQISDTERAAAMAQRKVRRQQMQDAVKNDPNMAKAFEEFRAARREYYTAVQKGDRDALETARQRLDTARQAMESYRGQLGGTSN